MFGLFGKKGKGKKQEGSKKPQNSPLPSGPYAREIKAFRTYFEAQESWRYPDDATIREIPPFVALKDLKPRERSEFLIAFIQNPPRFERKNKWGTIQSYDYYTIGIFKLLVRRKCDFTPDEVAFILETLQNTDTARFGRWPVGHIVQQLEKSLKTHSLTQAQKKRFETIAQSKAFENDDYYWGADLGKAQRKILKIIGNDEGVIPAYPLTRDAIGRGMAADLKEMDEEKTNLWNALFIEAANANGSKPTKKLQTQLTNAIDAIGPQDFKSTMHKWLAVAASPDAFSDPEPVNRYVTPGQLNSKMATLMKGLVWGMARFHDEKSLAAIGKLAEKCFERLPGIGPAAPALGNACIYTLANSKGLGGVAHLSRLKLRVKQNNTQKLIQKHIETQAEKQGLKSAEIEEMAAPDFGLTLGRKDIAFKDYTLALKATSPGEATLSWIKPDGSAQKSVPSFVKESETLKAKLKKARDQVKEIKKASTAQRDRIDRLYTEDMQWEPERFQQYYRDHGLVGPLARKLIWTLSSKDISIAALYVDDHWQDETGQKITFEPEHIHLWHPIESDAAIVMAWRERLETLEIKQPFKQAYREVYILTDAEVNTRNYSNRMAAHIIKQHQFNTLGAIRGWRYSLMGAYDDGRDNEIAMKPLPAHELTAEFWIDELHDMTDTFNDAGIWHYVATDQIRFRRPNDDTVDLIDVPPLILSEIMRDADLFVGVCSIGNDPAWQDRDGAPRTNQYWQTYSFGDLQETAKTRKAVLERLLPRLKIRDKARIDGKFLIVTGKKNSYKIHIGSTNILIMPNDRYLCIVPGRGKDKNVSSLFLPFEGDRGLSILLSKAFMLVDDDKITDSTITRQL